MGAVAALSELKRLVAACPEWQSIAGSASASASASVAVSRVVNPAFGPYPADGEQFVNMTGSPVRYLQWSSALPSNVNIEIQIRSTDTNGVLINGGGVYYLASVLYGSSLSPHSGLTAGYSVDGIEIPSATRDDLHGALCDGSWHTLTCSDVSIGRIWYTQYGGGFAFSCDIGSIRVYDHATGDLIHSYAGGPDTDDWVDLVGSNDITIVTI